MDEKKKPTLDTLVKGQNVCLKCGSKVPLDEVGGKCEIIECPKCKKK
ncbi:MAG: hypothetical protein WCW44_00875 [archaeon]|jgi:DNA-directed RNA polymerase subunit RPC12/RpoP